MKKTLFVFLLLCLPALSQSVMNLYVSPKGDDLNSGKSIEAAFKTLEHARDEIRSMKSNYDSIYINIASGVYRLEQPFELDSRDSGTDHCAIVWRAFENDSVELNGSKIISGWKIHKNGWWTVKLPKVKSGEWNFKRLYVNGEPRFRTRLPEKGFYRIADFANKQSDPWNASSDWFEFYEKEIQSGWKNLHDVEVVVPRFWVSSRQLIKTVDEKNNRVHFQYPTRYRYSDDFSTDGARYFVENVYEALDEPGEWYLDRAKGILTYIPKPGETLENTTVEAPVCAQLLRIVGDPENRFFVKNVHFSGITFTQNNWMLPDGNPGDGQSAPEVAGAVFMQGAVNCSFSHCSFVNLSSYALQIDSGCRDNRFEYNEMAHLGGGGVRMGGGDAFDHPETRTGHNTIADNHIHHIGEIYHAATGIWIQHSGNNVLTHNEIDHTYYSSIAIGWVWGYRPSTTTHNEISFNHIHHVGQGFLSDMGGIYMLGVAPGTIVKNNLIHDIESHGYGGWGIYTDEGSSHVLIENNIVYRTKCAPFDQHYGRENLIRNNIFAFAEEDLIHRSRVEEHVSFMVERNILYATGNTPFLGGEWSTKKYKHRPGKPWHDLVADSLNHIFDYNLYYNPDINQADAQFGNKTFNEWVTGGQDEHSLFTDPLFLDPENGNFELDKNSPAFKLGIKPIDITNVGPRK